jgi:hypothetical protein
MRLHMLVFLAFHMCALLVHDLHAYANEQAHEEICMRGEWHKYTLIWTVLLIDCLDSVNACRQLRGGMDGGKEGSRTF